MFNDARIAADLFWFYNLADAQIGKIPSTWPKDDVGYLPIKNRRDFLGIDVSIKHEPGTYELDLRVLHLVRDWRRIKKAIVAAGELVEKVLELRFRQPLRVERFAFDLHGKDFLRRLNRRAPGALQAELMSMRGCGALAHLTPTAIAQHRWSRSTRTIDRWLDVVGKELATNRHPSARRLEMADTVRRESEKLFARAMQTYHSEWLEVRDDEAQRRDRVAQRD